MLQVKLYSFAGVLVDTVSPKDILGSLSWSAQINGGQGELKIRLNYPMTSTIDADIVKVFETSTYYPSGQLVYTGVITKIAREFGKTQYIELTALGLATLFGFKLQVNGVKAGGLSSILSDTVDAINLSYNFFTKDIDSLVTAGNFDFQNRYLIDVINSVKQADWSWTVDGEGTFIWRNKSNQTTHRLTMGKNIEKISVVDNTEVVRNQVTIGYTTGTQTVTDAASVTEYGLREYFESKTDITSSGYASTYGTSKLVGVSRTLSLSIYDYDIYSILPGHRITVVNTPVSIQSLQIHKVTYGNDKATIEVEKIESIGQGLRT